VTLISASAGSGKTFLLRSWIGETGLAEHAAWVPVPGQERDPQRFWISVADALRGTAAGSTLVRELTAAPGLDGWGILERLLKDLAPLDDPIWLVIDDVHELGSAETLRQLELLVMRAPPQLRLVLATRHDLRLGLHRLRLEGELTEIRADDLRFSVAEARELFAAAGVELSEPALAMLHRRTEGWAAGLRSRPARSSSRWMRGGPGSATTRCSPTCWSWSCGAPRRKRSPGCMPPPPAGSPATGIRWRQSATLRPRGTGAGRLACCRTAGSAWSWTGRRPPPKRCWPDSRPMWSRPTRNSPR
jgi:hypothetical protein